jgi:hypothetical protein
VNNRIARGFLWGAVATIPMTLVHIAIWGTTGRLTVAALATRTLPGTIITKMFGSGLPVSTHLLLAMAIHLGYGGFWGAALFALTRRVTFWKGVAMGAFLYLGLQIFLQPLLGRGIFASESPEVWFLLWFSIATHLTYGASLGLLGVWYERATETALGLEESHVQPTGQKPVTPLR